MSQDDAHPIKNIHSEANFYQYLRPDSEFFTKHHKYFAWLLKAKGYLLDNRMNHSIAI
jgi:hypothetical protein